jgi:peptidoglycan hydrolase CwlO-like protein
MMQRIALVLLLSAIVVAGGASCRESSLRAQIKELESQQVDSQQKLKGFAQRATDLQNQYRGLASRRQARNSQTVAYMKEHALAITCMAAAGYSLGRDNLFNDKVNEMINLGTALCFVGVIASEDFGREMAGVVDELDRASAEIKGLEAQMVALNPKVEAATKVWADEKARYEALTAKIEPLASELRQLQQGSK